MAAEENETSNETGKFSGHLMQLNSWKYLQRNIRTIESKNAEDLNQEQVSKGQDFAERPSEYFGKSFLTNPLHFLQVCSFDIVQEEPKDKNNVKSDSGEKSLIHKYLQEHYPYNETAETPQTETSAIDSFHEFMELPKQHN